ncbi:MAG: AzlD domain-containing protein [Eubacteriales bacterium]|jgi:branched-subunit amino acid transport protein|nr:AzlD domain-containing protein [Eubacteriales bacterium]
MTNTWISILIMWLVTLAIRVLPVTLIRKPIKNQFLRSFLYYVPYVTLAVMTFPAILSVTDNPAAGLLALIAGIIMAWLGADMFLVAGALCGIVLVISLLL